MFAIFLGNAHSNVPYPVGFDAHNCQLIFWLKLLISAILINQAVSVDASGTKTATTEPETTNLPTSSWPATSDTYFSDLKFTEFNCWTEVS